MTLKCAHFADIHFRGLSRHDEYRKVFSQSFEKLKELQPDIIFLGGDIVHSKTQGISPELIDILRWWFTSLADIAPVHIILGNHDGLMTNEDRLDAVTPIVRAIGDPRIKLMKGTGVYPTGIPGYNWCVFCCFDPKGWPDLKPPEDGINIALYHGPVNGSLTDQDWEINGDSVKVDFFKGFDYTMLGDIHKRQFLTEKVAYPGSTIQQNYGEDVEKGFLFWEIRDKDDFDVKFIELKNDHAFRSIKWQGDVSSTLDEVQDDWVGSRFRVIHKGMTQTEFKQLQNSLREKYDAYEVVSKNEQESFKGADTEIATSIGKISRNDLRSFKQQDALMSEYVKRMELSDEDRQSLRELHKDIFGRCVQEASVKSHQWRLRRLNFDNTFGYGEGNLIDFDTLNGITGIFGKNRVGKSSIPGTISYSLFNASDRGTLKNIHIVNNRKNYCKAAADFSVAGEMWRAERQTVKRTNRNGVVSAPTNLNLFRIDESGNPIEDATGEQRRETEKTLRELVGTVDDFMMTSFASQGGMDAFIKEGSTQRKNILTRFLDLQIFDDMLKIAKGEMSELRGEMRSAPDRNWQELIDEQSSLEEKLNLEMSEVEEELVSLKKDRDDLKIKLAALPDSELYTKEQIQEQVQKLSDMNTKRETLSKKIIELSNSIDTASKKIEKIGLIKEQFPIEELREEFDTQKALQSQQELIESKLELELQRLDSKKKSAKKLESVPCGDQFPKCPYIKDAHKSASELDDQKLVITGVRKELRALKSNIQALMEKGLSERLLKYEDLLKKESSLRISHSDFRLEMKEIESDHQDAINFIKEGKTQLREMRLRSIDEEKDTAVIAMRNQLKKVEDRISNLDAERLYLTEQISVAKQKKITLIEENRRFGAVKSRWETYNVFMQAVDKKGIPLTILSLQLPQINNELTKILQGVVNFDLSLEADLESNNMEIFIDYGDSRRIIECGSGMEKMISSLALRVALINVCNAPRSDVLIIDEGFGALDDKNIEACSRLLESLKKYFANILIISHVDAMKDVVDNVLDIQKNGKDSYVRCT
jgi:DNA repair exonuclease SbcCD ATPase subunit/DNA repair exonuclease SbcCD nuclease subunit